MRKALNDNTTVQIVILLLLLLAAGLLFTSQVLNRKGGGPGATAAPGAAVAAATGGATPAPSAGSSTAAPVSTAATPAVQPASVSQLAAGPGLPRPVFAAYEGDKTIVLLIVRSGGIDDHLVRGAVAGLKGDPKLAVFVTRAKGIARYSRITEGVGVNQVPALVVVSPKSVSGSIPRATVSYGFRSGASATQAVKDAVYKGRTIGYDPG